MKIAPRCLKKKKKKNTSQIDMDWMLLRQSQQTVFYLCVRVVSSSSCEHVVQPLIGIRCFWDAPHRRRIKTKPDASLDDEWRDKESPPGANKHRVRLKSVRTEKKKKNVS